jgi:hypothetical protein
VTAQAGPSLRRRWDRAVLRLQGRLDGEAADRTLPWALALALFALLVALDAAAIRSLAGGSGLGPWLQAAWAHRTGHRWSPVGGTDPIAGSGSLVAYPLAWATGVVPPEALFTIVQSAALAVAVVPLWRLARRDAQLRVGASITVVAVYALAPTLQRTNLSTFHPEAIALPAILAAYRHARQGDVVRYVVLVALVLACRADLGITVAMLGLLVAFGGRRDLGLPVAVAGVLWSVVALLVLSPDVPDSRLTPAGEFVARSTAPLAVLPRLVTQPVVQLRDLLAEPSVGFLVVVLAPLLFLPLLAWRKLAAALPCLALAMMADRVVQREAQAGVLDLSPAAAHIAPALAFVFIALVFALERIGTRSVSRVNVDRRVLFALLAGAALLFLTESPTSPYQEPWHWGGRDAIDGARLDAVALVPDGAAVAVSPRVTAVVAERARLVELPPDPDDLGPGRIRAVAAQVDAVLIDTSDDGIAPDGPHWTDADRTRVRRAFAAAGFGTRYDAQGIVLLLRAPGG